MKSYLKAERCDPVPVVFGGIYCSKLQQIFADKKSINKFLKEAEIPVLFLTQKNLTVIVKNICDTAFGRRLL